jgi:branched-chain amino acid transport system permease protein
MKSFFASFGEPITLLGIFGAGLLLALAPILFATRPNEDFLITLFLQFFTWTTLAVSWNFFSGYSGYSSFGHGAFFGIGMYTASTLMVQKETPFLLTLPVAGAVAALAAFILGFITFRLPRFRGELFSLLTLAITFMIATAVNNLDYIDGGKGVFVRDTQAADFARDSNINLYYVGLGIVLFTVVLAYSIYHSRWGQALFAIRDDEDVANGLGVPTFWYKVGTFALSAFCVGMMGGTQGLFLGYIEASNAFAILTPLLALMMAILGGSGVWYGPIIGAVLITYLRQTLTDSDTAALNQIIIGMVLILTILFVPQGIAGVIEKVRHQWLSPLAVKREPQ